MGQVKRYDDAWIRANFDSYDTGLYKAYNLAHNTNIERRTFNMHCTRELGLKKSFGHHYTEEQKEWLKENYPKYGREETAERFNKLFGASLKGTAIAQFCFKFLGVSVTKKAKYRNTTHPVGSIHENKQGQLLVKTECGWIPANHSVVDVPKGYCTINLDKNKYNMNPDNIAVVSRRAMNTFYNNQMDSEDRDISLAGVLWAELYLSLLDKGVSKEKIYE